MPTIPNTTLYVGVVPWNSDLKMFSPTQVGLSKFQLFKEY